MGKAEEEEEQGEEVDKTLPRGRSSPIFRLGNMTLVLYPIFALYS